MISDAERTRLSNAKHLGTPGEGSLSELLEMLTDPSWIVRRAVVQTLALMGNEAIEPLCDILRTKRDSEARIAAAVDALVMSRGQADPAVRNLTRDSDTAVIADALQILGRRKSESSVSVLIELTRHENDIVAVGAIEALGRIGGRAAVEALIETVRTGNFFRTFPAIDILGRSGDRRVVEPLAKLLSNSTYLPEAARALGRSGEIAAIEHLVGLLKSPIDSVVRLGLVSLWDLHDRFDDKSGGQSEIFNQALKTQIHSDMIQRLARVMAGLDTVESIAASKLLGIVQSAEASSLLLAKLDGPAPVAEAAAEALKNLGKQSDLHLLQSIREGNSARRKILLPLVTRSATALDVAKCFQDPDAEVRAMACDTVARLGNTAVVPDVYKLLEDPNLRVVHAATSALQALGARESRELAVQASKSANSSVRRAALRILAYFGDAIALQPMLNGLNDEDLRVREVAIQGLPYLEDPSAYEALCQCTKSAESRIRALAVRALALVAKPDPRTYSLLLKALTDEDAWVRYYGCQSLGRLAYTPASQEVAELLTDEAGQVRVAAVEALSHMQSRHAHRALQQAAMSEEADVKRAALVGLGIMQRIEDLQIVIAAMGSADVATRLIAISAIVAFPSPLVLGALSSAAADADEQVRSAAIGFLAARPEMEATETLVELLKSESTLNRAKAALLVPQANRSSGILMALESANDEISAILISILLRSSRPDSKKALFAAMKSNNVAARKAAATGLGTNRDAEKTAILREAAENDPDIGVRDICTLMLSE